MLLNSSTSIVLNTCKLPFVQFLPFLFVHILLRMLLNCTGIIEIYSEILQSSILFVNYLIEHLIYSVNLPCQYNLLKIPNVKNRTLAYRSHLKHTGNSKFHKVILGIASPLFRNIFPSTTDIQIYHVYNQNNFLIITRLT